MHIYYLSTTKRREPSPIKNMYKYSHGSPTTCHLTTVMVFAFEAFALLLGATSAACANAHVLVDFQVAEPPPVPSSDVQTCTIMIFE